MASRITDSQRRSMLEMLRQDFDRDTIAAKVGVTPGKVAGWHSFAEIAALITKLPRGWA